MHKFLQHYLEVHGYWVLFFGTFLEGEAILIMAGFLVFQGYLRLEGVMLTAFAGAFCGDQVFFYLGRWYGSTLVRVVTHFAKKFRRGLRLIEKYGTFVAFISRYTYGFRIILPVILGMTRFPAFRFCWLNLISAACWAIIFTLAGYLFGKSASLFIEDVSRYEPYLMLVLAGLIASMWVFHFIHAWWLKRPARRRLKRMWERVEHDSRH